MHTNFSLLLEKLPEDTFVSLNMCRIVYELDEVAQDDLMALPAPTEKGATHKCSLHGTDLFFEIKNNSAVLVEFKEPDAIAA